MRKFLIACYALAGGIGGFLLSVPFAAVVGELLAGPHSGGGDGWSSLGPILMVLVAVAPPAMGLGGWLGVRLGRKLNPS